MLYFQGSKPHFKKTPRRIISIVPSQTELLYYLGIKPIAQTLFCVHPKSAFKASTKIGGTKKLNISKILALKPDLIIGNKEENEKQQIEELAKHIPVWLSDIYSLNDSFTMIEEIGELIGCKEKAYQLAAELRVGFTNLNQAETTKSCIYLIWREPFMAAGTNTFIHEILKTAGYKNVLPKETRYPEITEKELKELNPSTVLLSSEPYPFKQKHIHELQSILPNAIIQLVDGELFSWYGPRLLKTLEFLNTNRTQVKKQG